MKKKGENVSEMDKVNEKKWQYERKGQRTEEKGRIIMLNKNAGQKIRINKRGQN